MLESVSHDWHVQPSCQRPNRGPPGRREFSQAVCRVVPCGTLAGKSARPTQPTDCPRNLTNIRCGERSCQSSRPTGFPDDFHSGKVWGAGQESCLRNLKSRSLTGLSARFEMTRLLGGARMRATVWPSVCMGANFGAGVFTRSSTEDKKLRKDLAAGGPCFEGTLRNDLPSE